MIPLKRWGNSYVKSNEISRTILLFFSWRHIFNLKFTFFCVNLFFFSLTHVKSSFKFNRLSNAVRWIVRGVKVRIIQGRDQESERERETASRRANLKNNGIRIITRDKLKSNFLLFGALGHGPEGRKIYPTVLVPNSGTVLGPQGTITVVLCRLCECAPPPRLSLRAWHLNLCNRHFANSFWRIPRERDNDGSQCERSMESNEVSSDRCQTYF